MPRDAVSKAINHVKKWIKMRNGFPKFRQSVGRIKSARKKGEGRDYITRHRRHLIESIGKNTA